MRPLPLVLAIVVLAGCSTPGPTYRVVQGKEQPERSGIGETDVPWSKVIDSEDEWGAYWASEPVTIPAQSPQFDFEDEVIVHIQWDNRPSTGHRLEIEDADWNGTGFEVRVVLVSPGGGCVVGQAFTNPHAAVALDRHGDSGPSVSILTREESRTCGPTE